LGAATRPRYGGTLRVEIRESNESPDPPATGPGIARLTGPFAITRWEPGRRAVFAADENAPGGRPFLDGVEIEMGRAVREQAIDLEVGKADVVELAPNESRRQPAGRRVWSSAPVRLLAVLFGPRVEDARVREAFSLAVDRAAIHVVLLQRHGEPAGSLLPQWVSGYAFLFSTASDGARARALAAAAPAPARAFTLAASGAIARPIAERIALNARDAGLAITLVPGGPADARVVEVRIGSAEPGPALAGVAAALGLPEPAAAASPEAIYEAERALLEGFRVVPLVHLPELYGAGPRVRGGPGITPLGEWRFADLWLEAGRP
jgi:hypothetical protein